MAVCGTYESQDFKYGNRLAIHIQSCLRTRDLKDLFIEDHLASERAKIINRLVYCYSHPGLNMQKEGLALCKKAVEYNNKMLDYDDDLKWRMLKYTGFFLNEIGKSQETVKLLESALSRFLELGSNTIVYNEAVLSSMYQLSIAYRKLNQKQKALDLVQKNLELCEESLGDDAELTLNVMAELAINYSVLGRTQEAIKLLEFVLDRWKALQGEDDSRFLSLFLSLKQMLAVIYIDTGRVQEAVEMLPLLLEKCRLILGDEDANTMYCQAALGRAYDETGEPGAGIPLIVKTIEWGERVGRPEDDLEKLRSFLDDLRQHEAEMLAEQLKGKVELKDMTTSEDGNSRKRERLSTWVKKRL
ncbi:hypothetical protein MMC28_011612 [Mycoblastus sanguinarius]|nr:hypothetical protein [Mycoblastus sanguinarius]